MTLERPQREWQSAALEVLLTEAGKHDRGPWVPMKCARQAIQECVHCSSQAADGALRALLTVGLADRSRTSEGLFWRPTDAALRMQELVAALLLPEIRAISEKVEGIDDDLAHIIQMQEIRERLERPNERENEVSL